MAHSTWIALAVASLFLVYVTARGELPQYLATVLGPYPGPETSGAGDTSVQGIIGQAGQAVNVLEKGAGLFDTVFGGGSTDYTAGADYGVA